MSVIDEIKARIDIVQLVASYGVQLVKAGPTRYKAPCPFHQEKTPSFYVFGDTQGWHCFGACSEGGDIFSFVMKREHIDFAAALHLLAERAGVALQPRSEDQSRQDERADQLRGLLAEAARFFMENLGKQPDVLAYARKRGLSDATLQQFQIGYAPDAWQGCLDHLRLLGYEVEDIIAAGMAIRNEAGHVYDRFRHRLMIPISDERGRVVGFGARALRPEDEPKYLNSPQTALFDKSAMLYGLHLARRPIRESETAVIVEGYMDAIQAHQAGFSNVVAQMGTALTRVQLKALSKYARRLILALDSDAAGIKATMRGLDVVRQASEAGQVYFDPSAVIQQASKLDVELRVLTLPDEKDPDDLIRKDPAAWAALVEAASPVAEYVIEVGTAQLPANASLNEREEVARTLLPILLATENDLQRNANVQQLAYKLRLGSGRTLVAWAQQEIAQQRRHEQEQAKRTAQAQQAQAAASASAGQQPEPDVLPDVQPPTRKTTPSNTAAIERFVLACLLQRPDLLSAARRKLREIAGRFEDTREVLGPLSADDFTRTDYRAIFEALERALAQDDEDWLEFVAANLPESLATLADELRHEVLESFEQRLSPSLRTDWQTVTRARRPDTGGPQQAFERRVLELRQLRLRRENTELQYLLQDADTTQEPEYGRRVLTNRQALRVIVHSLKEMSQTQR